MSKLSLKNLSAKFHQAMSGINSQTVMVVLIAFVTAGLVGFYAGRYYEQQRTRKGSFSRSAVQGSSSKTSGSTEKKRSNGIMMMPGGDFGGPPMR